MSELQKRYGFNFRDNKKIVTKSIFMDNKYYSTCKTALIRCTECNSSGKSNGTICINCKGTGYLCQVHGANNGLPKKP